MAGALADADAGDDAEAEPLGPLFQMRAGQLLTDGIEKRVARILERACDVERHRRVMVFTGEFLAAVLENARAGDLGVRVDDALLQTCDGGQDLEGRAGRVHAARDAVHLGMAAVARAVLGRCGRIVIRKAVRRVGRHREHLARIRVERDRRAAPAVSGKGGFRLNIAQPFSSCKKKLPHFHNFVHTAHPVPLK